MPWQHVYVVHDGGSAPLSLHSVTQSKAWLRLLACWQQLTIFVGFAFIAAFLILLLALQHSKNCLCPVVALPTLKCLFMASAPRLVSIDAFHL